MGSGAALRRVFQLFGIWFTWITFERDRLDNFATQCIQVGSVLRLKVHGILKNSIIQGVTAAPPQDHTVVLASSLLVSERHAFLTAGINGQGARCFLSFGLSESGVRREDSNITDNC